MELPVEWMPTWYAPGVQKLRSRFLQLQETPLVKLLAKAGAMQGWLPLFNGRVKCVAAVRRPRDVPSAALRPTEPTPTPPAPAAGNAIPAAAGAARPGAATRKKDHDAAWRDALLRAPKQEVESDRLTKVEARVEQLEVFVAQWQPPAPAEVPMEPLWDPLANTVRLLESEFREYKAMMEQKLKEVQAVVRSQAQAAAAEIVQLKAQLATQQMELVRVRATQEDGVHQVHQIVVEPATPEKTENEIWAEIDAEAAARLLAATKYDASMYTPPKPQPQLRLSFPTPHGVANKSGRLVSYTTTAEQQVVPVASTSLSKKARKKQKKKSAQKHKLGGLDSSPALRDPEPAPGGGRGRRSPSGSESEEDISCHSSASGHGCSEDWSGQYDPESE
jgi:hypothetical protein